MVARIVFGGGEMGAFVPGGAALEVASASTPFSRAFMFCDQGTDFAEGYPFDNQGQRISLTASDIWLKSIWQVNLNGSAGEVRFNWYDLAGTERIRITYADAGTIVNVLYNVGAGWVSAGTAAINMQLTRPYMDLRIHGVGTANGYFALYFSGTLYFTSAIIDLSGIAQLYKFQWHGVTVGGVLGRGTYFAECVITEDRPTIPIRLMTFAVSANGDELDWTGTFTDVNEIVYNDATFITSAVAAQNETFQITANSSMVGYNILAMIVTNRITTDGVGIAHFRHLIRKGGEDYNNGVDVDPTVGFTGQIWIKETDPSTGGFWPNPPAIQIGAKSAA